jgi:hypothetical protein
MVFNPYLSVDGTLPVLNPHKLLPKEAVPPVIILPPSTPVDLAVFTMKTAWERQDAIVVWKQFAKGKLDKYADEEWVKNNFNDDKYEFLTNGSNQQFEEQFEELNLKSAFAKMENLYLGFSYTLLNNNKDTLLKDINEMLHQYGEDVANLIPVNHSLHHAFLYKGKKYHTGQHQAPVSDWFVQISNSKKWRFIKPTYTPYMRPIPIDGVSMMSGFDYLPDDCGIPFVDVTTEPGDLMFFPAHWWHEVHNLYDNHGIAFGLRPKLDMLRAIFEIGFPALANRALPPHRLLFVTGSIMNLFRRTTTVNKESGLKGRISHTKDIYHNIQKHIPSWTWDKFNQQVCTANVCSA